MSTSYLPPSGRGTYEGHAFLPPSGADKWVECAMWPTMTQRFPDLGGDESEEGTAAHWVNIQVWRGLDVPVGTRAPNGVAITEEMLDGADVWMTAIDGAQSSDEVETTVGRAPGVMNWGTPDLRRLTPGVLMITDYKFGHGFVDAFKNWQLVNYAELVLGELGVPLTDSTLRLDLGIVQPRNYHRSGPVRWWETTPVGIRPYVVRLHAAAARALGPEPAASPGPHCKHCPGRHACAALQRSDLATVDASVHAQPDVLTPDQLGYELRALDRAAALLEARRTGLQEQALGHIRAGERVPFYAVEQTAGREAWTVEPSVIIPMAQALGVDVSKPGVITPNQARKAGLDAGVVASMSERPAGAIKLVPDDGKRARQAFAA